LDHLSISEKSDWTRLLSAVNTDVNSGVVASTHQTRQRYWQHWQEFLPVGFDPYLQDLAPAERVFVLQGFAKRIRNGTFGRGKQVKVGSIQAAIGAIAKIIELAGFTNPLNRFGTTNYHAAIAVQTEAYHCTDPAPLKQMAVPVKIPNYVYENTRETEDR